MERALAASGSDRYRYRGIARTSPRRRAWSLHPSLYGGPAESAVSTPLLYLRLERGDQFRAHESAWPGGRRRDRALVYAADVRTNLRSRPVHNFATWHRR